MIERAKEGQEDIWNKAQILASLVTPCWHGRARGGEFKPTHFGVCKHYFFLTTASAAGMKTELREASLRCRSGGLFIP